MTLAPKSDLRGVDPGERLSFGLGRADITAAAEGMSMWGWGSHENIPRGAALPLYARALAIAPRAFEKRPFVLVTVELGMVSEALRRESLDALRRRGVDLDEDRFAITATHTHSGPSGFSTYVFYGLAGPGFSRPLLDRLVAGVVEASLAALAALAPGRAFLASADVPLVEPVSFNRSIAAYNRNHDVTPIRADRSDEGVSRKLRVVRVEDLAGRARGMVALFAVHGTSIHADNDLLHPDNIGVAARDCEARAQRRGEPDFVAIFAQEAAGDVTPNYRWDARRRLLAGRFDDDFESATFVGEALARHASALVQTAREDGIELRGPVEASTRYVDFHRSEVDEDLAVDARSRLTSTARIGVGFCLGTAEGPGPLAQFPRVLDGVSALLSRDDDAAHAPKRTFFDLGFPETQRFVGRFRVDSPLLDRLGAPRLRFYREGLRRAAFANEPLVPHRLPFQILRLGQLVAVALPFEPTTVAGRRVRAVVARELGRTSAPDVAVLGYANAYAGYLTTPEEYDEQAYEGASTLFGRASLGAVCTRVREVLRGMLAGRESRLKQALERLPQEDGLVASRT